MTFSVRDVSGSTSAQAFAQPRFELNVYDMAQLDRPGVELTVEQAQRPASIARYRHIVQVYLVITCQQSTHHVFRPLLTVQGHATVCVPVLPLSKEQRYLLEARWLATAVDGRYQQVQADASAAGAAPLNVQWDCCIGSKAPIVLSDDNSITEYFTALKTYVSLIHRPSICSATDLTLHCHRL